MPSVSVNSETDSSLDSDSCILGAENFMHAKKMPSEK